MPAVTPPSDFPDWANSATAPDNIDQPPASTVANGWPAKLPPPHEWVNWWWNVVGLWIRAIAANGVLRFDNLTDATAYAVANLTFGDIVTVFDEDNTITGGGAGRPGASQATGTLTTIHTAGIAVAGDVVALCYGNGNPVAYTRAFSGPSPSVTYTRTNSGENWAIQTDGTTTIIAYGSYVEAFNATTGASLWVYDNGSVNVPDVCMVAGSVFAVHPQTSGAGDSTANMHMHELNLSTGAVVASYRHANVGGSLLSVCTNGRQVFVTGSTSDYASGANVRAISILGGGFADATGEGGGSTDATGIAWDLALASPSNSASTLDCDGLHLYMGLPSAATNQLEARSQADGSLVWGRAAAASEEGFSVAVDQDYVFVAFGTSAAGPPNTGRTWCLNKHNGGAVWSYANNGKNAAAVATDGTSVYQVGDNEDQFARRIRRGNVPTRYRYVDLANEQIRFGNMPLQPEAQ